MRPTSMLSSGDRAAALCSVRGESLRDGHVRRARRRLTLVRKHAIFRRSGGVVQRARRILTRRPCPACAEAPHTAHEHAIFRRSGGGVVQRARRILMRRPCPACAAASHAAPEHAIFRRSGGGVVQRARRILVRRPCPACAEAPHRAGGAQQNSAASFSLSSAVPIAHNRPDAGAVWAPVRMSMCPGV